MDVFFDHEKQLLKKYKNIWDKVSNIIEKGFDSKPACTEKYQKTKVESYFGKINTHFHYDEIPKKGFQCIFLSVIVIDCKYKVKVNEIKTTDDTEISSDDDNPEEVA